MKALGFVFVGLFFCVTASAQVNLIVFVCEHGSAKSVIAATYFNKLAKEKNIPWQAVARGTNPDAVISPKTKKLLEEDTLLDNAFIPQRLSQQDVDEAKRVFLFYELPKDIKDENKIQYWRDINAVNDDFRKLRDDIVTRITPLIDSLAKQ
jgi:arsenate reductase (thioredoxin)